MIRSMTGFGSASTEAGSLSLSVEVRSVNHRFLQTKVRLPAEFAGLEADVEAQLKRVLDRGSVTLTLVLARSEARSVVIDGELAKSYRRRLAKLARELKVEDDVSMQTLVQLPGVLAPSGDGAPGATHRKRVLALVREALEQLVGMREAEGKAMEKDLRRHAKSLAQLAARVQKRMPGVTKAHHENLRRRVSDLLGESVEPADLARELALIADKTDVSEELARLESHLDQLAGLLADPKGAVGRRLDFLVQELAREVNTIGSKCNDAQVAHQVVELKTCVERMREQVQNVE